MLQLHILLYEQVMSTSTEAVSVTHMHSHTLTLSHAHTHTAKITKRLDFTSIIPYYTRSSSGQSIQKSTELPDGVYVLL